MIGGARQLYAQVGTATFFLAVATATQAAPLAHSAKSAHNGANWPLFAAGPFMVLALLGSIAIVALIAAGVGSLERLTGLGTRAARRLEGGFAVPTLWGVCAFLLLFSLAAVLFATKILAFLGLVAILLAFCLAGLGTIVAAVVYGRGIAVAMGSLETDDLANMRLGLWVFLVASAVPFIGWLVVFLAVAGGLGAVFQSFSAKKE